MPPPATRVSTIAALSALERPEFVALLGHIFEHSPWVAERTWPRRPFSTPETLHAAMCDVVMTATRAEQLALIRAHPELAGRESAAGLLTAASSEEQTGAGLAHCAADDLDRLRTLNGTYRERFGFPFVIAVKGLRPAEILASLEERMTNSRETELRRNLEEIVKISRHRLTALLDKQA